MDQRAELIWLGCLWKRISIQMSSALITTAPTTHCTLHPPKATHPPRIIIKGFFSHPATSVSQIGHNVNATLLWIAKHILGLNFYLDIFIKRFVVPWIPFSCSLIFFLVDVLASLESNMVIDLFKFHAQYLSSASSSLQDCYWLWQELFSLALPPPTSQEFLNCYIFL